MQSYLHFKYEYEYEKSVMKFKTMLGFQFT